MANTDVSTFIQIMESRMVADVSIPFFILLITFFFLVWLLIDFINLKTSVKILISSISSFIFTSLFSILYIYGILRGPLNLVNIINVQLPRMIFYPLPLIITMFPLIILFNKKWVVYTSILLSSIGVIWLRTPNYMLLILPISVLLLVYNNRMLIIESRLLKLSSILISSIIAILIILLVLIKNTDFYKFIYNWFGLKLFYILLVMGLVLWIAQTIYLYLNKNRTLKNK